MLVKLGCILVLCGVVSAQLDNPPADFKLDENYLTSEELKIFLPVFQTLQETYKAALQQDQPDTTESGDEDLALYLEMLSSALQESISKEDNKFVFEIDNGILQPEEMFEGLDLETLPLEEVEEEVQLAVNGTVQTVKEAVKKVNAIYKDLNIVIKKRKIAEFLYLLIRDVLFVLHRIPRISYCLYSRLPEFQNETLYGARQIDLCLQQGIADAHVFANDLRKQVSKVQGDLIRIRRLLERCTSRLTPLGKAFACFMSVGKVLKELSNSRWDSDVAVKQIAKEVPEITAGCYQCMLGEMKQMVQDIMDTFRIINVCIKL